MARPSATATLLLVLSLFAVAHCRTITVAEGHAAEPQSTAAAAAVSDENGLSSKPTLPAKVKVVRLWLPSQRLRIHLALPADVEQVDELVNRFYKAFMLKRRFGHNDDAEHGRSSLFHHSNRHRHHAEHGHSSLFHHSNRHRHHSKVVRLWLPSHRLRVHLTVPADEEQVEEIVQRFYKAFMLKRTKRRFGHYAVLPADEEARKVEEVKPVAEPDPDRSTSMHDKKKKKKMQVRCTQGKRLHHHHHDEEDKEKNKWVCYFRFHRHHDEEDKEKNKRLRRHAEHGEDSDDKDEQVEEMEMVQQFWKAFMLERRFGHEDDAGHGRRSLFHHSNRHRHRSLFRHHHAKDAEKQADVDRKAFMLKGRFGHDDAELGQSLFHHSSRHHHAKDAEKQAGVEDEEVVRSGGTARPLIMRRFGHDDDAEQGRRSLFHHHSNRHRHAKDAEKQAGEEDEEVVRSGGTGRPFARRFGPDAEHGVMAWIRGLMNAGF